MWNAVVLAFTDSVNALLIAVIVAIGIMLPRGMYRKVAPLLIFGDWLGVFLLALFVMYVFAGLQDLVTVLIEGPWLGLILIALAVVAAVGAWRAQPGGNSKTVNLILGFLQRPTWKTALVGFLLGVIQSATSGPYFGGIAHLSVADISTTARYVGMLWYATAALSLPTLVAIVVGQVRRRPYSRLGRWFTWARENPLTMTKVGGYVVAVLLGIIGILHL